VPENLAPIVGLKDEVTKEYVDNSGMREVWSTTAPAGAAGKRWLNTSESATGPTWAQLTQAEYDALSPKNPNVLYVIVG